VLSTVTCRSSVRTSIRVETKIVENCQNFLYAHEQSIIYEKQQYCLRSLHWFSGSCVITEVLMCIVITFHVVVTLCYTVLLLYVLISGARGGAMVKALRYKPAGRRFDFQWCHWNFSVT
jgi:hypothetical protein